MFWKTGSDNIKRKYNYSYDHLNRLLQADYSKEGNTTFNSYLEQLTYDKNGNIQSLVRNGNMDTDGMQFENPIDNLTYLYDDTNKNQLLRVFDATSNTQGFKDDTDGTDINHDISEAPDYAYDANGNMTEDKNKGIENIVYNHLNLPVEIVFPTGKITYLYNAVGQKVRKTVEETSVTTTTDYLSGFQYKNAVLQFFPHAEGYVNATESTTKGVGYSFNYVFNFTDHLGNIRLSYSKDPATNVLKIIEENHYYPFGLKHSGYNSDKMMYSKEGSTLKIKPVPPLFVTSYDKKFNGKSWETELGLNFYDYGARNYDPALGRWMNVDPLAEHHYAFTPYHYCSNNPINRIDPNGMCDDPNCSHSAVRRGWDSVGRFFGAWGYSEQTNSVNTENVQVGPIVNSVGDMVVSALRASESWFQSIHGTSTVDEDAIQSVNAGVNFTVEYKGTQTEIEFGIFSTQEDTFGFYSSTTESIGVKVGTGGLNTLQKIPSPSINIFAKANSGNSFNDPNIKTDTKVTANGELKLGRAASVGVTKELSLDDGSENTSYGIGAGTNNSSKVEAGVMTTITILNKTKEYN